MYTCVYIYVYIFIYVYKYICRTCYFLTNGESGTAIHCNTLQHTATHFRRRLGTHARQCLWDFSEQSVNQKRCGMHAWCSSSPTRKSPPRPSFTSNTRVYKDRQVKRALHSQGTNKYTLYMKSMVHMYWYICIIWI